MIANCKDKLLSYLREARTKLKFQYMRHFYNKWGKRGVLKEHGGYREINDVLCILGLWVPCNKLSFTEIGFSFLHLCFYKKTDKTYKNCSVWHDTAVPFKDVLQQFEDWLTQAYLWEKHIGGSLNRAAFVTW